MASCLGCHDPHPSNPFSRYLRSDPGANGSNIANFCAPCHPLKADPKTAGAKPRAFSSMNEQLYGTDAMIELQRTESTSSPASKKTDPAKKKTPEPPPEGIAKRSAVIPHSPADPAGALFFRHSFLFFACLGARELRLPCHAP